MSGRPTAEIVADLWELAELRFADDLPSDVTETTREAADRLAELDALSVEIAKRLLTYSTLRPPCPTCDGKQLVDPRTTEGIGLDHCPDCVDGKVSVEQLAATWRAVWDDTWYVWRLGDYDCPRDNLRAVRP